jgi:Zn finger protein HypA/HybF involved in hydrogenase expression
MVKLCNGICHRYDRANYKIEKGTGYCRNCDYGFHLKELKKYRCPCCNNVVRTHIRNSHRLIDEIELKRM